MLIFVTILQVIVGVALSAMILLQSGKNSGLSASLGGASESFLSKNKSKSMDAKIARATKWIGALFLVLTFVLLIIG